MNRRRFLQAVAAALGFLPATCSYLLASRRALGAAPPMARVRPGDSAWPRVASWERLRRDVGGRLVRVQFPLATCLEAPSSLDCAQLFKELKNPYFLGDEVGLTQSLGWAGAWTSRPSAYAVIAESTEDVVAAINFARQNNLRLVVRVVGIVNRGRPMPPTHC